MLPASSSIAGSKLRRGLGGDEGAVAVLVAAPQHALVSGAPETAITLLRRALDEPPPLQLRPALLLQLGFAEF